MRILYQLDGRGKGMCMRNEAGWVGMGEGEGGGREGGSSG